MKIWFSSLLLVCGWALHPSVPTLKTSNKPSPISTAPSSSVSLNTSHSPAIYASANPRSPRVNNLNQNLSDVTRMVALAPAFTLNLGEEAIDREVSGVEPSDGDSEREETVDVELVEGRANAGRGEGEGRDS
jgi:hypothetical protein